MAYVTLDGNGNVNGIYANPQGYTTQIDDKDARLVAWNNKALLPQVDAFSDARLAAGFHDAASGRVFQCDDKSLLRLTALGAAAKFAALANNSVTFPLIAADNTISAHTPAEVSALADAILAWVSQTVVFARTMKNNILSGQVPSDITIGWP